MPETPIDNPEQYPDCQPMPYLTINGHEKYYQINDRDFKVDFRQFIDKKSNKIKFKLSAIKKLLPYDGFYPQDKTKQIAGLFHDTFVKESNAQFNTEQDFSDYKQRTLALMQPFFAPGILFNTIKAGIAMSWLTCIGEESTAFNTLYSSTTPRYLNSFNRRIPFESILKLDTIISLFKKIQDTNENEQYLFYLDPTGYALARSSATMPKISINKIIDIFDSSPYKIVYDSCINNFLYETVNFFLKNKKLTNFKSSTFNKDYKIPIIANTPYSAIVRIKKSPNFSMFNQNNYSGSYAVIPSASLFGPPISGSSSYYHSDKNAYYSYMPPYFQEGEESLLLLELNSDQQSLTLSEIINNTTVIHIQTINTGSNQYYDNSLEYSLNLRQLKVDGDNHTWFIQTKFETPLINFSKCSVAEVTSSELPLYDFY